MKLRYVYTVVQEVDDLTLSEAKDEMGIMADDGFHSYFEDDISKHLALEAYDEKTQSWKTMKEEME